MAYELVPCDECDGSGVLYCEGCELPCVHDQLCRICNGTGWRPLGFCGPAFMRHIMEQEGLLYHTKAGALSEAERRYQDQEGGA